METNDYMNNYLYAIYFAEARHRNSFEYRKSFLSDGYNKFFEYRYSSRIIHAMIICEHKYGVIKINRLIELTDLKRSTLYRYIEHCVNFNIVKWKKNSGALNLSTDFLKEQEKYSKNVMKELKEGYDYIEYISRYSPENEQS